MVFKKIEWEKKSASDFVADVAFGIQLTVHESRLGWCWDMGNLTYVFKQGRCNKMETAFKNVTKAFQNYVSENIIKCCEIEGVL